MIVTLFRLNFSLLRQVKELSVNRLMRHYPLACNFSLLALLVAGYTAHNLYRSTWFMLAAMSGAMQLLLKAREAAIAPALRDPQLSGGPNLALESPS
jgi:hypothetical protein